MDSDERLANQSGFSYPDEIENYNDKWLAAESHQKCSVLIYVVQ